MWAQAIWVYLVFLFVLTFPRGKLFRFLSGSKEIFHKLIFQTARVSQ
jgi:hypothetical protein